MIDFDDRITGLVLQKNLWEGGGLFFFFFYVQNVHMNFKHVFLGTRYKLFLCML